MSPENISFSDLALASKRLFTTVIHSAIAQNTTISGISEFHNHEDYYIRNITM